MEHSHTWNLTAYRNGIRLADDPRPPGESGVWLWTCSCGAEREELETEQTSSARFAWGDTPNEYGALPLYDTLTARVVAYLHRGAVFQVRFLGAREPGPAFAGPEGEQRAKQWGESVAYVGWSIYGT